MDNSWMESTSRKALKTFVMDIRYYYILGMIKPIGNQYVGQVTIWYFTVSYSDIMQAIRYLKAYRMDLCKQCPTSDHHRVSKPHPQTICKTLLNLSIPFNTFCYITCFKIVFELSWPPSFQSCQQLFSTLKIDVPSIQMCVPM